MVLNKTHKNVTAYVMYMHACRSKLHQEQVLQQKIQSRKLEKIEESKQQEPYRVGSAKRYYSEQAHSQRGVLL